MFCSFLAAQLARTAAVADTAAAAEPADKAAVPVVAEAEPAVESFAAVVPIELVVSVAGSSAATVGNSEAV